MNPDEHFRKLERMYVAAPINEHYRPRIRISDGAAEVRMMVRPDFHHAASAMHGSVYFKALDDATFFAVSSLVENAFVLTVSFSIYFTRPVTDGEIVATGRVVHRSRRLYIAEGVLVNDKGKEVARGSGTFMPSATALTPALGYV